MSLGVHWDKEWLSGPLGLTPEQIRPNGLILCYPVVTAGEGCHRGSVERLLWGQMLTEEEQMIPERGTEEKEMLRELISLEKQVGSHTPPVFLWQTHALHHACSFTLPSAYAANSFLRSDLVLQPRALVCIFYIDAFAAGLEHVLGRQDVQIVQNRLLGAFKRAVAAQGKPAG